MVFILVFGITRCFSHYEMAFFGVKFTLFMGRYMVKNCKVNDVC